MNTIQFTLHSAHYTVNTIQCILHSAHLTVHSIQWTLKTIQWQCTPENLHPGRSCCKASRGRMVSSASLQVTRPILHLRSHFWVFFNSCSVRMIFLPARQSGWRGFGRGTWTEGCGYHVCGIWPSRHCGTEGEEDKVMLLLLLLRLLLLLLLLFLLLKLLFQSWIHPRSPNSSHSWYDCFSSSGHLQVPLLYRNSVLYWTVLTQITFRYCTVHWTVCYSSPTVYLCFTSRYCTGEIKRNAGEEIRKYRGGKFNNFRIQGKYKKIDL